MNECLNDEKLSSEIYDDLKIDKLIASGVGTSRVRGSRVRGSRVHGTISLRSADSRVGRLSVKRVSLALDNDKLLDDEFVNFQLPFLFASSN